ncbi:flagellar biosynthesis protein FlhB [Gimibacter soli]|uniref:Flagellar biosynthetic protein FlhB n=1 Tax=Gimibacter soli TaxID=3024400 RepID=A0AAE9XK82_9PROT|nr:flagellar biosynthesis protein FlhB [Gimibacter soli]WCL52714.1 flagellar biosynthesis protein FlhB [Gimibacter soli]
MAEQDDSQKTEEPTSKKLQDAIDKGNVASSQEFKTWFLLLGATFIIVSLSDFLTARIIAPITAFLSRTHEMTSDEGGIAGPTFELVREVFLIALIPMFILMIMGLVGTRIQQPPVFTLEKVKPTLEKVSPLKGIKKIFSGRTVVEFFKILAKLIVVSGVVFIIVWPERDRLDSLMMVDLFDVLKIIQDLAGQLFIGVLIILTFIAAADLAYQRHQHHKQLKMSKQEVKDEHKQTEGDPMVKARLRGIRMERARQRMMANVPNADVVITNPTHFAVALEYKHGQMDVPKLVAKGVDNVALKIREIAEENGVPIVENPPLARAIHATVEIDEEITPDHYKAVAEVIGYVMKLRRATGGIGKRTAR